MVFMTDIDQAMMNPVSVFKSPEAVVSAGDLSAKQKIEILRRWEYDARQLEVAGEEGMTGSQPDLFARIRAALHTLGYWPDPEKSAPTKQGG
jgi:hypothetical protein